MTSISTINVPFHGNNLYVVNYNGQPYVPMKPIVDGMGMDWASQFTKLKQKFKSTIAEITMVAEDGKERNMICLALRKLAGWLHTISPNKVKPEIRDKVIKYQEECDDVLYEYWTTGEVKKKHKSTVQERNPLKNAVNLLVSKKGIMYPEAYSLVHQKFNVSSIEELTADQIPDAVEYIHKFVLEGEYIPKDTPREVAQEKNNHNLDAHNIKALLNHYEAIYTTWKVELYPALRSVDSPIAGRLYDRFQDGYSFLMNLHKSITGKHPVLTK
ncbi:phage antirepressor N-terminal domain-containing protein [Proteus vulgaris]|uniref:phage antirepressor N-terminal domain-containing protein n=1 Tax=Proteus vulgaris TaxID=585 RepID=UPI0018C5977C|nr:phage antirepressor N-terminal domain-containing protein [Proteus vulgaris]MBG5972399.1 phage antirepressor N-terminal domain-containing protein [Proteus vulgaris]MDM3558777.1 phage antirepressor N-terminal domain-containing protein [Proteus vulgaris]